MIVEYGRSFLKAFDRLPKEYQQDVRDLIELFLDYYASRQYPKGLRVHKCNRFLSLSLSMNYRVFALPVSGGVKFVFVGNHDDAVQFLKNI